MANLRDKVLHRRSSTISKRPELYDIENGELALNYNAEEPGLYFKDLASDGTQKIRKVGPIHFGPVAPNFYAEENGYYLEPSNGECWIDNSQGDGQYAFKAWDGFTSQWIELSSQKFASKDNNLDQFLNGTDGQNFIHTEDIRLKINNKTALAGFSSSNGNKLVINENNQFSSGVELGTSYRFRSDNSNDSNLETSIRTTIISPSSFSLIEVEKFSATYRSAKYIFQVEGLSSDNSGTNVYQTGEILVIHDGSEATLVEYATASTYNNERSGQFDAEINTTTQEVILKFQKFAQVSSQVKVKVVRTSILV